MSGTDLPIPDYDHLPTGSLEHRIRALSEPQLRALIDYEHLHADRVDVMTVLRARLAQLEAGERPSGGDAAGAAPEAGPPPDKGGQVSPRTAPPPATPARHGVPGNPSRRHD